jgi:hypothetical protein
LPGAGFGFFFGRKRVSFRTLLQDLATVAYNIAHTSLNPNMPRS